MSIPRSSVILFSFGLNLTSATIGGVFPALAWTAAPLAFVAGWLLAYGLYAIRAANHA